MGACPVLPPCCGRVARKRKTTKAILIANQTRMTEMARCATARPRDEVGVNASALVRSLANRVRALLFHAAGFEAFERTVVSLGLSPGSSPISNTAHSFFVRTGDRAPAAIITS